MKVSIVVPVYNCEKYLRKCLNSIIGQTGEVYEILIIDDGSTDGSGDICDEYARVYNNIKVFHVNNSGVSSARNIGILHATGDYLLFVDSDDYVESDMISKMADYEGNDIICAGIICEKNNSNYLRTYKEDNDYRDVLFQNREVFARCFKREIVDDIRFSHFSIGEDVRFLVDVISKNPKLKVAVITDGLYHYVERPDSAMNRIDNYLKFYEAIDNEIEMYNILKKYNYISEDLRLVENAIYNFLIRYMRTDKKKRIVDKQLLKDVRRKSIQNRKIIFSYKKGVKRLLYHCLLVYFPGLLGIYIRSTEDK